MLIQKQYNTINFTGNLDWAGNTAMFIIIEEAEETIEDFTQGTARVLWVYFALI